MNVTYIGETIVVTIRAHYEGFIKPLALRDGCKGEGLGWLARFKLIAFGD